MFLEFRPVSVRDAVGYLEVYVFGGVLLKLGEEEGHCEQRPKSGIGKEFILLRQLHQADKTAVAHDGYLR